MPLSEHEQKLLDQIERALYQEDPKFATAVRSTDLRSLLRRRLLRAGLLLALGFGLLVAGVVTQREPISVVGFVVMTGALTLALTAWKRMSAPPSLQVVDGSGAARPARQRRQAQHPSGGSMTSRLEERWKRRWDERGR